MVGYPWIYTAQEPWVPFVRSAISAICFALVASMKIRKQSDGMPHGSQSG